MSASTAIVVFVTFVAAMLSLTFEVVVVEYRQMWARAVSRLFLVIAASGALLLVILL